MPSRQRPVRWDPVAPRNPGALSGWIPGTRDTRSVVVNFTPRRGLESGEGERKLMG